ncbi:hypothetical protein [Phaeobacter sp.]|uniref:hypothetical protein n=1 Tax=Phaeobacter sp. TaxID=1902409 RepID=UPI0025FA28B9|nr:hypothetical protein [Phaeobacter sp.]
MTTKPKAKKFRLRRNAPTEAQNGAGSGAGTAGAQSAAAAPRPVAPPTAHQPASNQSRSNQSASPQAGAAQQSKPAETQTGGSTDLDAIRKEGLTGRQLRIARRLAQKHNLPATSDFDAVRQLRLMGVSRTF